jgi:hypothetical protein
MKIIEKKISKKELQQMTKKMFDNLVKVVVDVDKKIMAVDAPMHSDEEAELIKNGSKQENLWGINLYPNKNGEDFIEYDSIINIKPNQNNRNRGIDDPLIRKIITQIVNKLVN